MVFSGYVTDIVINTIAARFELDNWNKIKNLGSKVIGGKMKKKEPVGNGEVPPDMVQELGNATTEKLEVGKSKFRLPNNAW